MAYTPDPTNEDEPVRDQHQAQTAAEEFRAIKAYIKYILLPLLTGRAPLASPAFTGVPTAPTPLVGTANTEIATTAFVAATALSVTVPGAVGAAGLSLSSDGTTASFSFSVPDCVAVLNYIGY